MTSIIFKPIASNIRHPGLPRRYEEAEGPCKLNACRFTIDTESGRCVQVRRVDLEMCIRDRGIALIAAQQGWEHPKQHRCVLSHPRHLFQLLHRRVQRPGQGAEPLHLSLIHI